LSDSLNVSRGRGLRPGVCAARPFALVPGRVTGQQPTDKARCRLRDCLVAWLSGDQWPPFSHRRSGGQAPGRSSGLPSPRRRYRNAPRAIVRGGALVATATAGGAAGADPRPAAPTTRERANVCRAVPRVPSRQRKEASPSARLPRRVNRSRWPRRVRSGRPLGRAHPYSLPRESRNASMNRSRQASKPVR